VKVFHYHQNTPPPAPKPERFEEEGNITINPKVSNKRNPKTDKLGEYVDYEEVK
jgi:hypothetical protein